MREEGLEQKLADLELREREVEKREKTARAAGLRRNLYEHINVSVGTIDVVIAITAMAIVIFIILGIIKGS
jgi:hypothetical protein